MGRRPVYRPDRPVVIKSGLFAGETGKMDAITDKGDYIKLVGRGWYSSKTIRPTKKVRYYKD